MHFRMEGHISTECTNDTICVRCGGSQHTSRDCKRPRPVSNDSPPPLCAPSLRRPDGTPSVAAAEGRPGGDVARSSTPLPPPPMGAGRSWREVVSFSGGFESGTGPTAFSAPFAPSSPPSAQAEVADVARPTSPEPLDMCYVCPSAGMVQLEEDLDRDVAVTVAGERAVTVDVATAAIHAQLLLSVDVDYSIRASDPGDFLILCGSMEVRGQLLAAEVVSSAACTLYLQPWSRQAGAVQRETPFLADLKICGIPAHAWTERTAIKLLDGCGIIDSVDPATAARRDMSCFRLSLWTHDVASIPAVRWLAVLEPGSGQRLQVSSRRRRPHIAASKVLWYRIRFWVDRWIIAGTPPSSDGHNSDRSSDRAVTGSGGCNGPDLPMPAPWGGSRRRRRRRAPRRRRGQGGVADAVVPPPTSALLDQPALAPASAGRWRPTNCSLLPSHMEVAGGPTGATVPSVLAPGLCVLQAPAPPRFGGEHVDRWSLEPSSSVRPVQLLPADVFPSSVGMVAVGPMLRRCTRLPRA
ncbi:hypothetical protein QYE76_041324 [Lolium multiflorum]|uniref:CCHC-type domain-containing protein n=1 Tax=Lolium multiflorum TaxID=4521 RepID=A0AAD8WVY4_LOLMU|nr:hypothetical protein QYE76_041324 [Lolium multiflorum]